MPAEHALMPRLGALLRGAGAAARRTLAGMLRERRCLACAAVFLGAKTEAECFCPTCRSALARRSLGYCPRCGELAEWPELPLAPCGRCLAKPPSWTSLLFHGAHEGLLRELLIRLKFNEQVVLGHALGGMLASHPELAGLAVDVVIPVPLHHSRLAARGFNQALELSRPLARRLSSPLVPGLLDRVRATSPQTGTSRETRMKNTRDAFTGAAGVAGKRVLLVDDTLTTGATVGDAARALQKVGATAVHVAVVSRMALRH